jgi:hypothetical protein
MNSMSTQVLETANIALYVKYNFVTVQPVVTPGFSFHCDHFFQTVTTYFLFFVRSNSYDVIVDRY